MPLSDATVHLLARSVGVYVLIGDVRLNGMKNNYHQTTATAVNGATARVSQIVSTLDPTPIVPNQFLLSRFTAAKKVMDYINGAVADLAKARDRIDEAEFVIVGLGLPYNALTANNAPVAAGLRAQWQHLTMSQRADVAAYARSRAANAAMTNLVNMGAVGGVGVLVNLQALANISAAVSAARAGDGQRFSGITPATLGDLRTLYGTRAPNGGFAGFNAWGPGDHGSAPANLRWHFLKHVCGITDNDDVVPDLDEAVMWWRRLTIQLTWAQYTQNAYGGENVNEVQAWFTGLNQSLSYRHVKNFLRRGTLTNNPRVLAHMIATYETAYRDDAINSSRNLTEVLVQSNGVKTFISGGDDRDDLFVIGRLDAGVLGISSCYIATDLDAKMNGARANKVWPLV